MPPGEPRPSALPSAAGRVPERAPGHAPEPARSLGGSAGVAGTAVAPGLPDETLLVRVALGDQSAFAVLYERRAAQVYGLVRRVLRDPAQSEEVAQEVLLEVWRTAPRYDPARGSAAAWIMTMAHRRAVDRVRSEQAARTRDERVSRSDDPVGGYDVVAEEVEVRMEHAEVRLALDHLTDLQREAVELAYFRGHTYREVAELLQAPLGTVKTRLRDGLLRLRGQLGSLS